MPFTFVVGQFPFRWAIFVFRGLQFSVWANGVVGPGSPSGFVSTIIHAVHAAETAYKAGS